MKCQNCGNELDQEEVFCGQCGAPNATQAQQTEMMQAPPPGNSLLGNVQRSRTSAFPPSQSNPAFAPEQVPGSPSTIRQSQPTGSFYQDATEAISATPGMSANYPSAAYPPQGFAGGSPVSGYHGSSQFGNQAQPQQFLTGNYGPTTFAPTQFPSGQFGQAGYAGGGTPQPAPKRGNVVMVVGIVCLIFAIISVGVFGALFALRNNNNNQPQPTSVALATATPTPQPTPTPSPTPQPTPTIAPTPTPMPDPNFSWCGTPCTQKGFQTEVYQGWNIQDISTEQGIQFTNPDLTTYLAVKLPTGSASPSDLINADLQQIIAQDNVTPTAQLTQCPTDQPIGGESWDCETTTLQASDQNQTIYQAMIYATVYQNQSYVIELVSPQSTFPNDQNTYFTPMLNAFKFVAPTQ